MPHRHCTDHVGGMHGRQRAKCYTGIKKHKLKLKRSVPVNMDGRCGVMFRPWVLVVHDVVNYRTATNQATRDDSEAMIDVRILPTPISLYMSRACCLGGLRCSLMLADCVASRNATNIFWASNTSNGVTILVATACCVVDAPPYHHSSSDDLANSYVPSVNAAEGAM